MLEAGLGETSQTWTAHPFWPLRVRGGILRFECKNISYRELLFEHLFGEAVEPLGVGDVAGRWSLGTDCCGL